MSEAPASGVQASARLIEYAPGCHVALPTHTTYGLVEHPVCFAVPGAARYACGLLSWQGMYLPLLDFAGLVDVDVVLPIAPHFALVVAFQRAPHLPLEFGALALSVLPQTIVVGNAAQCALPTDSSRWLQLALSCFLHHEQPVPILDTARLFAAFHDPDL